MSRRKLIRYRRPRIRLYPRISVGLSWSKTLRIGKRKRIP